MSIGGVQEIKNIEEEKVSLLTLDTGSGSKSTKFMKIMHNFTTTYHQFSLSQYQTVVMVGSCMQTL